MRLLHRNLSRPIKPALWLVGTVTFALAILSFGAPLVPQEPRDAGLTVHEWGTFTGIADEQGKAVEWTAYGGSEPYDLPDFVESISGRNFKGGLRGTIRMETPVIYFYSPRQVNVSVEVTFSQGLITEWYPHAASVQSLKIPLPVNLDQMAAAGSIAWKDVTVSPSFTGEFLRENRQVRYYAARETSAAPLVVNSPSGQQQEKFLFYRGVSAAPLPLTASQDLSGGLLVESLSGDKIPALVYFERSGNRIGYSLSDGGTEVRLNTPTLDGDLDSLNGDLTRILIDQGLYPEEAQAMLATWHDSWFEEGSRLFYIVPRGFIDKVLPLNVDPAPAQLTRVFVGRLEIVSPDTIREVAGAVKVGNLESLAKYGRFRDAILQIAKAHPVNASCASACGK
jgi:hypothetical protein